MDQAVEVVVVLLEEVAEAHQEQVQVEQQCVQVESRCVEVDKCGHVVHRVVYLREMRDV